MRRVPSLTSVVALAALSLPLSLFTPPAGPQTNKCQAATPNFYSLDKEKELASQVAKEVVRSSVFVQDSIVIDYLNRLGKQIAKTSGAEFPITIRVLDSDMMEASTLPGGFQYVNRGLILATESEAELAGVLAHGIARTNLRSSTALATKAELTQLVSIPAMIFIPYTLAGYASYQGTNLAIPLTFLKFSRDSVRQADFCGLQHLYDSGYDPESYLQFVERLLQSQSNSQAQAKSVPKVLSPLPPLTERIQALREEIDRLMPPRDTAVVSSSEYEAVKERLKAWESQRLSAPNPPPNKPTLRLHQVPDKTTLHLLN
jgi:predicted Zn-dependent protease